MFGPRGTRIVAICVTLASVAGLAGAADGGSAQAGLTVATLRLEDVFPAGSLEYMFAGRLAVGPVLKADADNVAFGAGGRYYLGSAYSTTGMKPYFTVEGGYRRQYEPYVEVLPPRGFWTGVIRRKPPGEYADPLFPAPRDYRYYFRAAIGMDYRVAGVPLVPALDVGGRREFRGGNEAWELDWTMGLRYVW
jgi:hypothetical protein